ncbi:MAG: hypothetical protein ACI4JX_05235 [Oscillospiraceae bacterium]
MIRIDYLNPRMLIADEGKVLTNGEAYSAVVYLGAEENADNWSEITSEEAKNQQNSL